MSYDRCKGKTENFLDVDVTYRYKNFTYVAESLEEYVGVNDQFPMVKTHHYYIDDNEPWVKHSIPFSPYFHPTESDFIYYIDMGKPGYNSVLQNITTSEMLREIIPAISTKALVALCAKLDIVKLDDIRHLIRSRYVMPKNFRKKS